jgi:hypothetical protein
MAVNTCTVITAPGRLRQEEFQLEASETLSQKKRKKGKGKKKLKSRKVKGLVQGHHVRRIITLPQKVFIS